MLYKHMQSYPWTLPTYTILTSVMGCTVNPKILRIFEVLTPILQKHDY